MDLQLLLVSGYSNGEKVDWMDGTIEEVFVWKEMMYRPNVWVDATLPLRMDMESKM